MYESTMFVYIFETSDVKPDVDQIVLLIAPAVTNLVGVYCTTYLAKKKAADQLRGDSAADLHLCFGIFHVMPLR